tara:strand:+ start:456 stop:1484 length:1029 start_codon:yes stop_codon:yes gene_type:complete
MAKITADQIRQRLQIINQRRQHYEWKSGQPERLARHEVWRHTYLANPYLIGAPDDRVGERFESIFLNVGEINQNGKLSPVAMMETDEYMQVFTHMLEEYESRPAGRPPDEVIQSARKPLLKYFEHGTPIGVTMFEGYKVPATPIVVKYGKRQFLEPMLQTGELRLANASLYNNAGFLDAVRDDETSRTFFIPTYNERLDGKSSIDFQGQQLEFGDDDIVFPLLFDDYYLFSLCEHIHYQMPTDFDADAAIVIRDPALFKQRLISSFLARYPDWIPMEGAVIYYDPYRDYAKFSVPHMAKHFGYAYQKEVRIAFRPRIKVTSDLEPLFLSIGPMTQYADLVYI